MLASRIKLRAIFAKASITSLGARNASIKSEQYIQPPQIVWSKDGSMIAVWHKPADFPYECTRPLPAATIENATDTVLKTQMSSELLNIFNNKTPELARLELMNITHTTKHLWFPRARDKRAKKTPMERKYL